MQAVRDSLEAKRPGGRVQAVDAGLSAPVRFLADEFRRVPVCTDPEFSSSLFEICRENSVGLVIPTIDTELPVFALARQSFAAHGIDLCISGEESISIAGDKTKTHQWLIANRLPTIRQVSLSGAWNEVRAWRWPLIAKPRGGSASIGIQRIDSMKQLECLAETSSDYIVQEMARGREFTINLYVNRNGKCVCAVPHWRMEVRAGEVSKGATVKDASLMELGCRAAESLPDARGPLNLQCFLDDDGTAAVIELNARFGGGYPLAHRAGARFTDWLIEEQEGREIGWFDAWQNNLAMLRYDDAVFVSGDRLLSI